MKNIFIIIIITFLSITAYSNTNMEKSKVTTKDTINKKAPTDTTVIALIVNAQYCIFELKINDKTVLEEVANSSYTFSNGIEHYLKNGSNKIEVIVDHPSTEQSYFANESSFSVKIVRADFSKDKSTWVTIKEINSKPDTKNLKNGVQESITDSFNANSSIEEKKHDLTTSLFLEVQNCKVDVSINNINIIKDQYNGDGVTSVSLSADLYLIDGNNSIEIKVEPIGEEKSVFGIEISSMASDKYSFFDENSWIKHFVIDQAIVAENKTYSNKFEIVKAKKMTWKSAPKIVLDKKMIKKIDAFIKEYYSIVKNKNEKKFLESRKYLYEDIIALSSKGQSEMWQYMQLEGLNYRSNPLVELKTGDYKLSGDGRLIHCVGDDGLSLFRCESNNEKSKYIWSQNIFIGLVDGQFYVLLNPS